MHFLFPTFVWPTDLQAWLKYYTVICRVLRTYTRHDPQTSKLGWNITQWYATCWELVPGMTHRPPSFVEISHSDMPHVRTCTRHDPQTSKLGWNITQWYATCWELVPCMTHRPPSLVEILHSDMPHVENLYHAWPTDLQAWLKYYTVICRVLRTCTRHDPQTSKLGWNITQWYAAC